MANQPQQLTLPPLRTYSRTEFTALRARVKGLPIATIARLYFDSDTTEPLDVERLLRTMRDDLVARALQEGSAVLVSHLQASIAKYGEPRLTPVSLQMIEQAAGAWAAAAPAADHPVNRWWRPLIADRLAAEGIATLGELVDFCNRRGGSWWRSVPRIGAWRARVLVAWLRRHADTIGRSVDADVDTAEPLMLAEQTVEPARGQLVPLERLAVPHALSGSAGTNRAAAYSYIQAPHDLAAVRAYLSRYAGQDATQRAYRRELERLLLWAVVERGVALSSMQVEDCEAYKAFLAAPSAAFSGPPASRASGRWRPFGPGGLSLESQLYAVRAIRAAFEWLVKVRYLAGNPWAAVVDPKPVKHAKRMQVSRALPVDLWARTRAALADWSEGSGPHASRWRAARALLLLMGDAGLRIAEATAASRDALELHPADGEIPATWELRVIGKRRKERFVPLSGTCIDALRAHWRDRGIDFDAADGTGRSDVALIAPLVIPRTPRAREKFAPNDDASNGAAQKTATGYSVRGARGLAQWAVEQLLEKMPDLTEPERRRLAGVSPHAFRHTFGTQSVATDVPLDVVQQLLGHASLQTTSVYVTAEEKRRRAEIAKYHARLVNQK
ncbi:TPA: site-specific integrase [Burkholderia multivorans]|uniref:Site-specific integrase n=1 Tax=Burkholderia multivorans TaxID=87883 RepID=A0AAP2HRZ5_9BURK|nr:site-specific integrase [Burkholderia multivorans]KVS13897.1 integrase [Burkholderia multivorans]MBU9360499.1 site-specific integrase [Burkholderia multivorans]MBU9651031.1 site-specific integrase [Burkholderia multivorans]MCL4630617.1 site-specific integrase [Burkholderia multivorans]MCO1451143.1 site-specific integrase [Burkholderia multivorans]